MNKFAVIGIIGLIVAVVVIAAGAYWLLKDHPEYVLSHIENNSESSALYVAKNGDIMIAYQDDRKQPLASTVKIILAMEYAEQVGSNNLDPNERVSLMELEKYYFSGTDGGAHPAWLDSIEGEPTLHEVVKGMITYSSNANTDYLIEKLGRDSIQDRIATLSDHEPFLPIVGSMLVPIVEDGVELMNRDEYREAAWRIHDEITSEARVAEGDLSMPEQRLWSDHLTSSTARTYGELVAQLNRGNWSGEAEEVLRDVLEWPMQVNEGNAEWLKHLGMKGGSTAFVLNQAMYADRLDGEQYELVILLDDLGPIEQFKLQRNMNSFFVKMLADSQFLEDAVIRFNES
ncbi:serine hydrolase [Bacillus sp. JCM 19034]|uniref:serine hydrolase n=1 Tax=Bacillus sp. JCM 19034 TaxID=1481928 RepID=UPI000783EB42|nr:serine hydrolase [Bacillus sp. JCM 19034]